MFFEVVKGIYLDMEDKTDFREAFIKRIESTPGVSIAAVHRGTGISKSQLEKLFQRRVVTTNSFDALKIARFFGCSLEEFLGDPPRDSVDELMARIRALPPAQQMQLIKEQLESIQHLIPDAE